MATQNVNQYGPSDSSRPLSKVGPRGLFDSPMEFPRYLRNERGLALVVALMLLVLLTVMGLAAISTTTTEIKLTSNERTDTQAFQVAEAGIKEILYRASLPAGMGTILIKDSGSQADAGGIKFDAAITDPGLNGAPNPNWKYNIYFETNPPASAPPTFNTRSILPAADWGKLNYSGPVGSSYPPVTVRYLTEQDLINWGVFPHDVNGDGDNLDLVYFNGDRADPQRLGAWTIGKTSGTAGTVDTAPPNTLNKNLVVRLVEATARAGNAKKTVMLETSGFPVNPSANAAMTVDIPITLTGSSYISGFNHSEATTKDDEKKYNRDLYNNNKCDNYSNSGGSGDCGLATDPDASYDANYSQMATTKDMKPAVVAKDDVTVKGSFDGWGGDENNTVGWKKVDENVTFPDLKTLLNIPQETVDKILAGANTNPSTCPTGVTYIKNTIGGQNYTPAKNCPQGSGILVVDGDMKITSQFEFRGLIYVKGDVDLSGGSWFLGAMAVKGTADGGKTNSGGSTILYSKATVENAVTAAMNQLGFSNTTLSWREQ